MEEFLAAKDISFVGEEKAGDSLEIKSTVAPYLKLAPPESPQQSVEFSHVFRIPLSLSFREIYRRVYNASHPEDVRAETLTKRAQYVQQNVKLVDLRPKRWYRELATLARRIGVLNKRQESLSSDIKNLEKILSETAFDKRFGEGNEVYEKLEALYYQAVNDSESVADIMSQCERQRDEIIHEISQGGYVHKAVMDTDKGTYIDAIYESNISDSDLKALLPFLKPVDFVKDCMTDNTQWGVLEGKLSANLLTEHNALISPEKRARYEREAKELSALDKNPSIMAEIGRYQKDIDTLDAEIADLKSKIEGAIKQSEVDVTEQIELCNNKKDSLTRLIQQQEQALKSKEVPVKQFFAIDPKAWSEVAKKVCPNSPRNNPDEVFDALIYQSGNQLDDLFGYVGIKAQVNELKGRKNEILANKNDLTRTTQDLAKLEDENANSDAAKKIIADATERTTDCKNKRALLQSQLTEYKQNALPQARAQFIAEWNDPKNYDAKVTESRIDEKADSVKDFYAQASKAFGHRNIHRFELRGGDFYTENGLPLQEFMSLPATALQKKAAIIPYLDEAGKPSTELFWGVLSPQPASRVFPPKLPVAKIVETNLLEISWERYVLSELTESVNLFPGEKKQITVEKQTKLTRTVNQSRKESQEEQRRLTSSFEENLRSELSTQLNISNSEQQTNKSQQTQSGKEQSGSQNSSTQENENVKSGSANASLFKGAFSAEGKASSTSKSSKTASQTQSKEAAYQLGQSNEGQTLNKTTRDITSKNLKNTIDKVSSETSSNNKLEISSSSSEQYEESNSNKESMQIENPNLGCTVNYNFYQLQNVYVLRPHLKDTKIVLDTGILMVEGVDVTAKVVCELEEFNKLFKLLPRSDVATVLCAFIARRVLKNYAKLTIDPTNMGILRLKVGKWENEAELINKIRGIFAKLNLMLENIDAKILDKETPAHQADDKPDDKGKAEADPDNKPDGKTDDKGKAEADPDNKPDGKTDDKGKAEADPDNKPDGKTDTEDNKAKIEFENKLKEKIKALEVALIELQKFTFELEPPSAMNELRQVVNAPAYHVDTQLGQLSATEDYLEKHRQGELRKQEAKTDHIRARSEHERKKGAWYEFHGSKPASVTLAEPPHSPPAKAPEPASVKLTKPSPPAKAAASASAKLVNPPHSPLANEQEPPEIRKTTRRK